MALLFTMGLCALAGTPASAVAAPPTATTEAATAVGYEQATIKGAVNPEGSATSYWFEYGKTTSYGTKIPVSPESVGSGTSNVAISQIVTGLSQSTAYHFRVVAENESGAANGEDATFTTAGFNFSFGEEGSGNGQLKQPNLGIATDFEGNIWVADTENNRVEKFNSKGEYQSQFGKEGTGNGEFKSPKGLAVDSSGNVWIVDSGNDRVEKFNSKGEYLGKFGEEGSGEGQFNSPSGIAFDSSDRPLIVDTGNNRVEKFNGSFKYLSQFGKEGTGNGEFKSPTGIVVDAAGRIFVTDTGNDRVERFSGTSYFSKFGETGTGNGKFDSPTGVASDFQERLWVVDSGNNRAQKFSVTAAHPGEYLDQVGEKGSGAGQLNAPTGVAAPSASKLLVLDSGNSRVESWTVKAEPPTASTSPATDITASSMTLHATINPEAFTTSYYFEYGTSEAYGNKVPITPESIGSGSSNVQVGQPITGLSEGTVYHFRVVAESAAGTSKGIDRMPKTLKLPKTTTEAATIVKATQATLNGKVNPLGSATKYWFEYGETTSYGTKIPVSPESIGSGTEYVAVSQTPTGLSAGTTYHFRVVAESEAGTAKGADETLTTLKLPKATTEAATGIKLTQATLNGKVNPEGMATSYYFEYGKTTSYGTKIPITPESVGSGTSDVPVSQTPTGLSEGTTYHFRVVAEGETGIRKGVDKTFTTGPSFSISFGTAGSGNGQFLHPAEIAIDSKGDVWVADLENNRIQKFDKEGKYLARFGEEGEGECQLLGPKSLAVDAEGNIWVDDAYNNNIQEYDEEGSCLFQFGEAGSEPGQLAGPESIAIDAEGNIWVADTYNGRLQRFDPEGNLIEVVGSYGSEPGQLGEPTGIDVGPNGNLWVADWQNKRVSVFNEAGEFVRQFGKEGSGNGEFINPDTIEVDEAGNVWVLDEGNSRVQRFDEEGKYLGKFGTEGSGKGQFNFGWPAGITSDGEGNIWVADSLNNRVQKWVP